MDLKTRIAIFAYLKNLKAPAQTHFLKHYQVEEYEVVRNVDVVKFEHGSFNFCGLPIGFDKLTGGECEPDYNTLNVRLKSIWDNNIDNIREEYPYLTVENFYNYNIIGNIHDNPELLETE